MNRSIVLLMLALVSTGAMAEPSLTIYNQDFAVVRESFTLDLVEGENRVTFDEITAHVEPDSVILRDAEGNRRLQILEQNYRNDPVTQELLLSLFEGDTIDFLVSEGDTTTIRQGTIVRAPYVAHNASRSSFGPQYWQSQFAMAGPGGMGQPIIELEGAIRFGLPGQPLFPNLGDASILKPQMNWVLATNESGRLSAELSYVSGGFTWEADYNLIAPQEGDALDLVGWVTLENQSGRSFEGATVKLMAGDVNKLRDQRMGRVGGGFGGGGFGGFSEPQVTEQSFDEYHLYTLERQQTLLDRELKQVEFLRAGGIASKSLYVYDGAFIDPNRYNGWNYQNILNDASYGTESNPKVWVYREFENTEENDLGLPLPKGRLRLYREGADGDLEFVGEDAIDHTPKDETVRIRTGNAFDLVGERRQTNYEGNNIHGTGGWVRESFEIALRNHKESNVEIRVVEHLYRWHQWEIENNNLDFEKTDSNTIEFRVPVEADGEATISYTAFYPRN